MNEASDPLYILSSNGKKEVARGLHVKFALDEQDMVEGFMQVLGECCEQRQYDLCIELHVPDRHVQSFVIGIRDCLRAIRKELDNLHG